ncbi:MAG: dihydroneopterin aldolase family protein [Candidatus Caldarchaeum sp.]
MDSVERVVRGFFPKDFTDRERAVFEAGIALGSIVHSVAGLPVAGNVRRLVERAVEAIFLLQPYRRRLKVRVRPRVRRSGLYRYGSVSPEDLDVEVEVGYGQAVASARMRYVRRIKYPLMYVERINRRRDGSSPRPYAGTRKAKARRKSSTGRGRRP